METGFLFGQLSEFKQNLLKEIRDEFPKETEKFIKTEAGKCLKVARKIAKREVGTSKDTKKNWQESKSYHKKFKVGKPYKYSKDLCCRAYNSSPHAHLIEYGHVIVPRGKSRATTRAGREEQAKSNRGSGFVMGKLIFTLAELEFVTDFLNDSEAFLFKYFDKTTSNGIKKQ